MTWGDLPETAPLAIKTALLRTLQEALSNATRHAGTGRVRVELRSADDLLDLTVIDEGPGFDVVEAHSRGRLGLVGMRERAEVLGGTFGVDSPPGHGTAVHVRWPLSEIPAEIP